MRALLLVLTVCLGCPEATSAPVDDTLPYEPFNGGVDTGAEDPTAVPSPAADAGCEADAPGERLACHFAARARRAMPDADVSIVGDDLIRIDGQEMALDPLRAICERDEDSCSERMDEWIAALAEAREAERTPARAEQLRPVLKHRAFVDAVRESSPELGSLARPFVGDVHVMLVVDFPRVTRALTPEDLAALHMSAEQAHARAVANLREHHGDLPIEPMPNGLRVMGPTDGYAAARLLLLDRWADAAGGGELLVAPSNRDLVLLGDSEHLQALQEAAFRAHRYVDHPITEALWRYTPEGWVVHTPPAEADADQST
ncbi:MAG: hypothetical protein CMN30_14630 [Sandaracinus sp.]|nr:hypothetical protein [Sandaracinus sp.]